MFGQARPSVLLSTLGHVYLLSYLCLEIKENKGDFYLFVTAVRKFYL